jgi:hypothetical protein
VIPPDAACGVKTINKFNAMGDRIAVSRRDAVHHASEAYRAGSASRRMGATPLGQPDRHHHHDWRTS